MSDLFSLEGHTALVAGGTGGIGRVLARALLEQGATVAVLGTSAETSARTAEELARVGPRILGLAGDATRTADVDRCVAEATRMSGRIDLLVNCVGSNVRYEAEEFPEEAWDRIVDLNLKAAFLLSQRTAREMIRQGKRHGREVAGKMLHVSSVRSHLGIHAGYAAYCASKGGLNVLVKQLATEWAERGILVNAIAPTFVRTPLVADMLADAAFRDSLIRRIPLGRVGDPQDLVGAALFFLSPASDFVTGQILFVDGGLTACQ